MSQPTTWGVPQSAGGAVTPSVYAADDLASLNALLSSHQGAARPTYAVAGTVWSDNANNLYYYDGTNDYLIGNLIGKAATQAVSGTTGGTLTAAEIVGGPIVRSGPTAAFSDATDTAAALLAAVPGAYVGAGFEFTIKNTTAYLQTLTAGTGVTLAGTTTVAATSTRRYLATFTNVTGGTEAVTITGLFQASN